MRRCRQPLEEHRPAAWASSPVRRVVLAVLVLAAAAGGVSASASGHGCPRGDAAVSGRNGARCLPLHLSFPRSAGSLRSLLSTEETLQRELGGLPPFVDPAAATANIVETDRALLARIESSAHPATAPAPGDTANPSTSSVEFTNANGAAVGGEVSGSQHADGATIASEIKGWPPASGATMETGLTDGGVVDCPKADGTTFGRADFETRLGFAIDSGPSFSGSLRVHVGLKAHVGMDAKIESFDATISSEVTRYGSKSGLEVVSASIVLHDLTLGYSGQEWERATQAGNGSVLLRVRDARSRRHC